MASVDRDYRRTLTELYRLRLLGTKLGLKNIRRLLKLMDAPHRGRDFFHLAGTNGKGSTGVLLQALLEIPGERVGLFTSPHLEDFRERIKIGGETVSREEVIAGWSRIRPLLKKVESAPGCSHPTFFEAVTALACDCFRSRGVETVIWETGMGGRLDATNVVRPRVAVITNISLDHSVYLGSDLAAVAREKAGIIKTGVPLVTAERDPEILTLLERAARRKGSPMIRARDRCRITYLGPSPSGQRIDLATPARLLREVELPLFGLHQLENLAAAWAAASIARPELERAAESGIRAALKNLRWPGRFEVFEKERIILDGAHNPAGAEALAEALNSFLPDGRLTLVLGVLRDKDAEGICRPLLSRAAAVIAVKPPGSRGRPARELARICRRVVGRDGEIGTASGTAGALERLVASGRRRGWICVAGSLRLAGEARSWLRKRKVIR